MLCCYCWLVALGILRFLLVSVFVLYYIVAFSSVLFLSIIHFGNTNQYCVGWWFTVSEVIYSIIVSCPLLHYLLSSCIPQESISGSLFFNMFINYIITDIDIESLLYADSLELLLNVDCLEIAISLKTML